MTALLWVVDGVGQLSVQHFSIIRSAVAQSVDLFDLHHSWTVDLSHNVSWFILR